MIIDMHTHIGNSLEDFPQARRAGIDKCILLAMTKGRPWQGKPSDATEIMSRHFDPTGEKSYRALAEIGVDRAVLLPLDWTLMGEDRYRKGPEFAPPRTIEEMNKHTADVVAKHSDRYIAFAGIDPRYGPYGIDLLRKAVHEWGVKGLKLHPCAGWYPNDRKLCYPFYELCCGLDIPVVCHCGIEMYQAPGKWADPMFLDEVASDFPELRLCLAHGAGGFGHLPSRHLLDVGLSLAAIHENVFLDTGSAQSLYLRDPVEFYRELRRALDIVPGKMMWGTDNPSLEVIGVTWKGYLDVFRNPDMSVLEKAGVSFTKEETDGVLGENARHWLKLE